MRLAAALLLLALLAPSHAQPCSTTVTGPVPPPPCPFDRICLIRNFGFPAADRPNSGVCIRFRGTEETCSVDFCSMNGPRAICTTEPGSTLTRCRFWARRSDGLPGPICIFPCPRNCVPERFRPVASNGQAFCNACVLKQFSCESQFRVFGPVNPRPTPTPTPIATPTQAPSSICRLPSISPFDGPICCQLFRIGCIPEGGVCTTSGGLLPPIPCERDLTCVLTSFGNPPIDLPNQGTCQRLDGTPELCSTPFCNMNGESAICRVAISGEIATCLAWSTRLPRIGPL